MKAEVGEDFHELVEKDEDLRKTNLLILAIS